MRLGVSAPRGFIVDGSSGPGPRFRRAIVGNLLGIGKLERIGPFDGQPGNLCQRAFGRQIDIFASKGIGAIDGRWLFGRHAIGGPPLGIVDRLVGNQRFEFGIRIAILRVGKTRLAGEDNRDRRQAGRARKPSDRRRAPCHPCR